MIILEKPYVSDFLIETIKKNNFKVLNNEVARNYLPEEYLTSTFETIKAYNNDNEPFYTNSENSINWIAKNLADSDLNKMIELSKDKALFRRTLKSIFPNYFFKECEYENLKNINPKDLKFPLILKPAVGFLSFGVYPIYNIEEWQKTLLNLEDDIKKFESIFPKSVVNTSTFVIEEMIEGEEYALDAYFDENGKAVILNIFEHPFSNGKDVSDRAYYTSKPIMKRYLRKFEELLNKIAEVGNYKNFPFHLELRVSENDIIPIEINPLRFCGWCITDIAYYAWGINVYEYYFKKLKPNWDEILDKKDGTYYYFTMGDIPNDIKKDEIKDVDYWKYLHNISHPLDIRKIDFKTNPVFAIVFGKTKSLEEIENLLTLNTRKYIETV